MLITVLLILILAVLLVGAPAVLGFLRGVLAFALVLAGVIIVAMFFDRLLPYLAAGLGLFALAVAINVGRLRANERNRRIMAEAMAAPPAPPPLAAEERVALQAERDELAAEKQRLERRGGDRAYLDDVGRRLRLLDEQLGHHAPPLNRG